MDCLFSRIAGRSTQKPWGPFVFPKDSRDLLCGLSELLQRADSCGSSCDSSVACVVGNSFSALDWVYHQLPAVAAGALLPKPTTAPVVRVATHLGAGAGLHECLLARQSVTLRAPPPGHEAPAREAWLLPRFVQHPAGLRRLALSWPQSAHPHFVFFVNTDLMEPHYRGAWGDHDADGATQGQCDLPPATVVPHATLAYLERADTAAGSHGVPAEIVAALLDVSNALRATSTDSAAAAPPLDRLPVLLLPDAHRPSQLRSRVLRAPPRPLGTRAPPPPPSRSRSRAAADTVVLPTAAHARAYMDRVATQNRLEAAVVRDLRGPDAVHAYVPLVSRVGPLLSRRCCLSDVFVMELDEELARAAACGATATALTQPLDLGAQVLRQRAAADLGALLAFPSLVTAEAAQQSSMAFLRELLPARRVLAWPLTEWRERRLRVAWCVSYELTAVPPAYRLLPVGAAAAAVTPAADPSSMAAALARALAGLRELGWVAVLQEAHQCWDSAAAEAALAERRRRAASARRQPRGRDATLTKEVEQVLERLRVPMFGGVASPPEPEPSPAENAAAVPAAGPFAATSRELWQSALVGGEDALCLWRGLEVVTAAGRRAVVVDFRPPSPQLLAAASPAADGDAVASETLRQHADFFEWREGHTPMASWKPSLRPSAQAAETTVWPVVAELADAGVGERARGRLTLPVAARDIDPQYPTTCFVSAAAQLHARRQRDAQSEPLAHAVWSLRTAGPADALVRTVALPLSLALVEAAAPLFLTAALQWAAAGATQQWGHTMQWSLGGASLSAAAGETLGALAADWRQAHADVGARPVAGDALGCRPPCAAPPDCRRRLPLRAFQPHPRLLRAALAAALRSPTGASVTVEMHPELEEGLDRLFASHDGRAAGQQVKPPPVRPG